MKNEKVDLRDINGRKCQYTVTGYVKYMLHENKEAGEVRGPYEESYNYLEHDGLVVKFPPKVFKKIELGSSQDLLCKDENVSAGLIGTCIDYMSRLIFLKDSNAFDIAKKGAVLVDDLSGFNQRLKSIKASLRMSGGKVSDKVLKNALQMCVYDTAYRSGTYPVPVGKIEPDKKTCDHIRFMLNNVKNFFEKVGIPKLSGFTVNSRYDFIFGDGDFLSDDYVLDFKTISGNLLSKMTLQILLYYVLGLEEGKYDEFSKVKKLLFFNPRKNIMYTCSISDISDAIETMKKRIDYDINSMYAFSLTHRNNQYEKLFNLSKKFVCSNVEIVNRTRKDVKFRPLDRKNYVDDEFLPSFKNYKRDLQILKKLIEIRLNELD